MTINLLMKTLCLSYSICFFSGCLVRVQDEIFPRNVELEAAINHVPVHVTDSLRHENHAVISPHIFIPTQKSFSPTLEGQFRPAVPDSFTQFQKTGLEWNQPMINFGIDIDYPFSKNFAYMAGMSSSLSKNRQYLSGYVGVGGYRVDTRLSFRLDLGLLYSQTSFKTASVDVRTYTGLFGSTQDTLYFVDNGNNWHVNFFLNATLNSSRTDWACNYFLQIGILPQTLIDFTPINVVATQPSGLTPKRTFNQLHTSVLWLSATPGLYFTIGTHQRLLVGAKLFTDTQSSLSDRSVLVAPMIQLDWFH